MSQKIQDNSAYITQADEITIYTIVTAIAMTDYRPVYWETFKDWIAKKELNVETNPKEIIWLKFGGSLCLLDIFKVNVLKKCLSDNYLKPLIKRSKHKLY